MKKIMVNSIIIIPLIVLSIAMIIVPSFVIDIFDITIALLFVLNGIKLIIQNYTEETHPLMNYLAIGIFNIVIGLLIYISGISLVNILPIGIAIGCMFYTIRCLLKVMRSKTNAIYYTISGIITLVIAVVLLSNLNLFSELAVRLIGVLLLWFQITGSFVLFKAHQGVPFVKRIK